MEAFKFIVKFWLLVAVCAFAAAATGGIALIPALLIIFGYLIHYLRSPQKKKSKAGGAKRAARTGPAAAEKTPSPAHDPPVPPTHRICRHCGAENALDGVYCESCGHKLT